MSRAFYDGGALLGQGQPPPKFEALDLPRSPGSVFGGLTVITSSAVPPGCALLYAEPSVQQQREMAGMTVLERAEYMHRNGRATVICWDEEASR